VRGGTGKTTSEMQMATTYLGAGWDFVGETANGTDDLWVIICEGLEYPHLKWEVPFIDLDYGGGSGSIADPYLISDPNHLQTLSVAPCDWNRHFKVTADLDLTGVAMTPIGNIDTPFSGTFNGFQG